MNFSDKEFKRTARNIGIILLLFLGLFNIFSLASSVLSELLSSFEGHAWAQISSELFGALMYLLSFLIPALIYRAICSKKELEPIRFKNPPSSKTPLIILASIAIIFCSAFANSVMVSFFGFSEFMEAISPEQESTSILTMILSVISTAVVPSICEEILFRGTILSNLLPYGRNFAIISSAVLFGLMHQNPAQIFYATMAGIVLGYAYVKTDSIWCVILIHFFNNLVSVIQSTALAGLEELAAYQLIAAIELVVISAGIISAILLIKSEKNKKSIYQTGSFELILEPTPDYHPKTVSFSASKGFFLSPTVLIFTILTVIEILSLIIMSLYWV